MLAELRISGLGVIDDATLELGPGFTAVTGETGAGKTMVVSGLGLLSGGKAGPHGLMGIGANFIPKNMDISLIDEIICVREEDAYAAGRDMVAGEGVLVGITAGAALWAATQLALRPENAGKTIVALLPVGGERYLSTPMYQGE